MSTVPALVVSGVLPAIRVLATVVRHRRLDAIGALVLSGIALGTVMGLASGSARLYLLDGIVPTVALGFVCLLSLFSRRPVMFRIALETMGEDTDKGRAFADLWQYASFRRIPSGDNSRVGFGFPRRVRRSGRHCGDRLHKYRQAELKLASGCSPRAHLRVDP